MFCSPMPDKAILLLNDDPDFLEALSGALKARGHQVVTATTAGDALARMREIAPFLIMTDMQIADSDGVAFLSMLRDQGLYDDVPKVVLSGDHRETVEKRLEEASLQAPVLSKLTDLGRLMQVVHKACAAAQNGANRS